MNWRIKKTVRERKRLGWSERGWRGPSWGPYSLLHLPGLWRKSVSCTNDSQTAQQTGLGSLRRHCSISGSASPFIFLFPAPYTFFHLRNLPLGLVLHSLLILSGQLSGPAWNISFIGTAECMFIYPLCSFVFLSFGQVIKSSNEVWSTAILSNSCSQSVYFNILYFSDKFLCDICIKTSWFASYWQLVRRLIPPSMPPMLSCQLAK